MQDCYDGIETETVDIEARNVFCGAYNVLILNNLYVFMFVGVFL